MAKSRGRRNNKKEDKPVTKESFASDDETTQKSQNDQFQTEQTESTNANEPNTFFGLVDATELDYFKTAESTLNANVFENDEDRGNFVTSVLEESKGKELKLVTNQICSKLVERLILHCTDAQLKQLFKDFNGHYKSLIYHKYASHCIETLLVRVASLIEREMLHPEEIDMEEQYVSAENLFIMFLNEISGSINDMIKHQYASHTVRLTILILSGNQLPSSTMKNSTLRSKRSKIARKMIDIKDNEDFNKSFQTPTSFRDELAKFINTIRKTLDLKKAREYSIDKVASPVLQLLIQVEGLVDRERPIFHTVFLPADQPKDQKEESFMEYLLSDAIGSHFLQHCIEHTKTKYVERLFNFYMKDRVLKLVKRSKSGDFIIMALLKNLKQNEVKFILLQLIPEFNQLIDMNIEIGITIIEASEKFGNFKKEIIIEQLTEKIDASEDLLEYFLKLSTSTLGNSKDDDWPTLEERKRTEFLIKLISYDDGFLGKIVGNLLDQLAQDKFLLMCKHSVFSRLIETIMQQAERLTPIQKRRLLNLFADNIADLSMNVYASHIVDKLWNFTFKLKNYKERFANEMNEAKDKMKESNYGRLVWKNWGMEKYVRKRFDWDYMIKQEEFEWAKKQAELNPKPSPKAAEDQKNDHKNHNVKGFNDRKRRHEEGNTATGEQKEDNKKQKIRGRGRR